MIKNSTFLVGLGLLFWGAYLKIAPDWDYGVSILMAVCTYLTAKETVQRILKSSKTWGDIMYISFYTWFAVDGVYTIYWFFVDKSALLLREVQWPVSLDLYLACGVVWLLDDPKPLSDSSVSRD